MPVLGAAYDVCLTMAMFWAPWPFRTQARSSLNVTSRYKFGVSVIFRRTVERPKPLPTLAHIFLNLVLGNFERSVAGPR